MPGVLSLVVVILANVKRSSGTIANLCSTIDPAPTNQICGQNGRFNNSNGSPYSTQVVSADVCRDYCLNAFTHDSGNFVHYDEYDPVNRFKCGFFTHDSAKNTCKLYFSGPMAGDPTFVADHNSTVTFTSATCYTCTQKCNLPSHVNLLYNPGFNVSADLLGPWFPNARIAPFKGPGNSVRLLLGKITQQVGLCARQDYIASVDYLVRKPRDFKPSSRFATISMFIGDCSAGINLDKTNVKFGEWYTITCSTQNVPQILASAGVSANDASLIISTYPGPGELDVYFANPQVRQISSPRKLKTVGKSLLVNGGFETGSIEPWVIAESSGTARVNMPGLQPIAGLPASKHKFVFYGAYGGFSNSFLFMQNTTGPLELGELYLFTMEYRQFATDGFAVNIGATGFDRQTLLSQSGPLLHDNSTMVLSRIFTGSGAPVTVTVDYHSSLGEPGRGNPHTRIELDNISVRKLARQKI